MNLTTLGANPFLQGGAVLGAAGIALAWLRKIPGHIWSVIKRQIIISVDIQGDDPLFSWFTLWLAQQNYGKKSRSLIAVTKLKDIYGSIESPAKLGEGEEDSKLSNITVSPAPGYHFIWYKKRLLSINRSREKITGANSIANFLFESYTLTFYTRNRQLIEDLFTEVRNTELLRLGTKITFNTARSDWWEEGGVLPQRSLDSVILQKDKKEDIINDMSLFLNSKKRYHDLGIPWRRGYLFFGTPGTGKTSLITTLAHKFQMNLYSLPLSSGSYSDLGLTSLYRGVPDKSIVVVEDVDCLFEQREKKTDMKITFSGFLNAIDGIFSGEGKILIMTTNHIEKLDPALIRPGRVDLQVEFGKADRFILEHMFKKFFPKASQEEVADFLKKYPENTITPAEIQQDLLRKIGK